MTTRKEIVILTDYGGHFYSSHASNYVSMDLDLIRQNFHVLGFDATIKGFSDVNFRDENYAGKPVLYTSSEDPGLLYKDYVEDILLGLVSQGAFLIPRFECFRAHHNKVFGEILRDLTGVDEIKRIKSWLFGTYEDFKKHSDRLPDTMVLKSAEGAAGEKVFLSEGKEKQSKIGRKLSFSPRLDGGLARIFFEYILGLHIEELRRIRNHVRGLSSPTGPKEGKRQFSYHRRKFLGQNFVPGISEDFKVLVYGKKYYVLLRKNRINDFRASGSGRFEHVVDPQPGLLDFAERVYASLDVPFISLDIGISGSRYYLFEFQCLHFGNLTLESSEYFFMKNEGFWKKYPEQPVLEREFVRSVVDFITRKTGPQSDAAGRNGK
jgi:hypothetical protein